MSESSRGAGTRPYRVPATGANLVTPNAAANARRLRAAFGEAERRSRRSGRRFRVALAKDQCLRPSAASCQHYRVEEI